MLSIILLALLLRLINLNQSFWLDEAAQALESARPFNQQLDILADFHPPLYHYLVHFWMTGGLSEWWLRLTSVLPGIATVILIYLITKKLTNHRTGILAALLLAIAPYHIYYSQELRMYSLATFFATALIYSLLHKNWLLHTIAAIGGVFTLYLFPLTFIAEALFLISTDRKSLKPWLISLVTTTLAFSIWIPHFLNQLHSGVQLPDIWPQWRNLSSPGILKTFPLTFAKFALGRITFDNNLLYGGLVSLAGLFMLPPISSASLLSFPRRRESMGRATPDSGDLTSTFGITKTIDPRMFLIFLWLLTPLILAWILSLWIPINGPWRLLFTLPAFYILLASGISMIKKPLHYFFLSGTLALTLLGTLIYHTNPTFHREDWRSAIGFLNQRFEHQPNAIATFAFPEPFAPYRWYSDYPKRAIGLTDGLVADEIDLNKNLSSAISKHPTIYHFEYLSDLSDPQRLIPKWLESHGYSKNNTYNYRGVGFIFEYSSHN